MKIKENVDLSKFTTFKMGGIAKKMYIPENEDELIDIISKVKSDFCLGGGSNLIINQRIFDNVINLKEFNSKIVSNGDGSFTVGASVRLQKLILSVNNAGYGGIEYLFSVPGLVGGAIVMNAGRGEIYKQSISDYVKSVKVLYGGTTFWLNKEECNFTYRNSKFRDSDYIILAVRFCFEKIEPNRAKKLREERITLCKKVQDNSFPNFGSVFCVSNPKIMKIVMKSFLGKCGNIYFSRKTPNWILNKNGKYKDVKKLIHRVEIMHKLIGSQYRVEVKMLE